MPILLAGTIEFVHSEQVSALFTFRLGQVLLLSFLLYTVTSIYIYRLCVRWCLCGLVVRVPGYRSRDPCSIPGAARFSEK
jgi:hypothetical protein